MRSRILANCGFVLILMGLFCAYAQGAPVMSHDAKKNPARAAAYAMPPLDANEERVLLLRGTEPPFSGAYWNLFDPGNYHCRQCGAVLFASDAKFTSACGWPSFDDAVPGAVKTQPDADGTRTEIVCATCGGHLGHVFIGEGFTPKNVRHCVNSLSLVFSPSEESGAKAVIRRETAVFAGGCFWGIEHLMGGLPGVLDAVSGYSGGGMANPTYKQVCTGRTGHAEAVQLVYDPARISFEDLCRVFFEIHDPTQLNRQGPDVGPQYRSAIFFMSEEQKEVAKRLIKDLKANGYDVVTEVTPFSKFYPAEQYHQNYFVKNPQRTFCATPVKRFIVPGPSAKGK